MDQRERQVIDELFGKLRQVEGQAGQRDAEAEAYIRQQVTSLPAAPYYMAQAILVQEQALASTQARVQELERQLAERPAAGGGGFLSGLFGGGQGQASPASRRPMVPPQQQVIPPQYMQPGMSAGHAGSPWSGGGAWGGRPAGGGFLAGAMQTALGVAGGVLIADAISSAFDTGTAEAADLAQDAGLGGAAEPEPDASTQDAGYEDAAFEDTGADAGGFDEESI
jgi:hypothetical protein